MDQSGKSGGHSPTSFLTQGELIGVPAITWVWAEAIAYARSSVVKRGDREKVFRAHLSGAFGEVITYNQAHQVGRTDVVEHFRSHMFKPEGSRAVWETDMEFPGQKGVDVKTISWEPWKVYFSIDAKKHQRTASQVSHYYCVICSFYSSCALLLRLVPYEDVNNWMTSSFQGHREIKKRCLSSLVGEYYGKPFDFSILKKSLYKKTDIEPLRTLDFFGEITSHFSTLLEVDYGRRYYKEKVGEGESRQNSPQNTNSEVSL